MKSKTLVLLGITVALVALLGATGVVAGPSRQDPAPQGEAGIQAVLGTAFTYQGQLKKGGSPVNGTCDLQFKLYDAASGGTQIGSTQSKVNVAVSDGLFAVELDFGATAFRGDRRWLEIAARCPAGSGSYTTLSPRQELTAAPYALTLRPGADIVASVSGRGVLYVSNESSTNDSTGVYGSASAASGITYGGYFKSTSADGRGALGWATASSGTTYGLYGRSDSASGRGVQGYATGTSGETYGVLGLADSPAGHGVHGKAPVYGVYGETTATSGGAIGVFGVTNSSGGYGVHGVALAASGETRGVSGIVQSPDGIGGYFKCQGADGLGLRVESLGALIEAWDGSPLDRRFRVTNVGNVYADGTYNSPAADLAEMLPASEGLEPGDVLVIGPDGRLERSTSPYATHVAGVHSTSPAFVGGSDEEGANPGKVPLAVVGITPVKASAENGPITPGDLLTSSSTPGHAMRADRFIGGAIIGKALEGLSEGRGVIRMLVMLQ